MTSRRRPTDSFVTTTTTAATITCDEYMPEWPYTRNDTCFVFYILFFWVRFGCSCVRVTFAYHNTIRGQIVIILTFVCTHIVTMDECLCAPKHRTHWWERTHDVWTSDSFSLVKTGVQRFSSRLCWYILNSFAQRTKFISDANIYRIFSLICVFFFVSVTNIFRHVKFLKISVQTDSPLQFCINTHLILAIDRSIVSAMLNWNSFQMKKTTQKRMKKENSFINMCHRCWYFETKWAAYSAVDSYEIWYSVRNDRKSCPQMYAAFSIAQNRDKEESPRHEITKSVAVLCDAKIMALT